MKKPYFQTSLQMLLPLFQVSLVTYLILQCFNLLTNNFADYYLDFKLWAWLLILNALLIIIIRRHAHSE